METNQNYNAWFVIGILVLLIFSVGQTFTIINHKQIMNPVIKSSSDGSETYEEMMARMHPDQAKQTASKSSPPTMVGGC